MSETMPRAVSDRIASDRAPWAALTAGTHEPEPDPSQVVRDRRVVDVDADRSYGDGVEHVRQSRLSRWQAQR